MAASAWWLVAMAGAAGIAGGWAWSRRRRGGPGSAHREVATGGNASGQGAASGGSAAPTTRRPQPGDFVPQAPQAEIVQRDLIAAALDDVAPESLARAAPAAHQPLIAAAAAALDQLSVETRHLPRRPSLLPKLLQAMHDEASLRSMARIIEQDPALAGNLLQVANSPYYRTTAMPVASLERAITQVGTQGLRSLIATALVQPVLAGGTGRFSRFPERIWDYTVYVATAAESHANRFEEADGFAAQLIGLLQGLGAILVYRVLHEQYAAHPELEPDPATFALLLEARTGATARRIAESWELSTDLAAALEETVDPAAFDAASPLARSLRFGRIAGALVFLCRLGRIGEVPARAALLAAHPPDPRIEKTWERLVKAYIRA